MENKIKEKRVAHLNSSSQGKRFKPSEKHEILEFLETHTYKETCEKYGVSEPTIARWKKSVCENSLECKQLNVVISDFWFDYLNELVEDGNIGKDQRQVIEYVLRQYARDQVAQKASIKELPNYLNKLKDIITATLIENPEFDAFLVWYGSKVWYTSENWGTTDDILMLLQRWTELAKHPGAIPRELAEFEHQKAKYAMRDVSSLYMVSVKRPLVNFDDYQVSVEPSWLLIGWKRIFDHEEVIVFGKTKLGKLVLINAMDKVKRVASGMVPHDPQTEGKLVVRTPDMTDVLPELDAVLQQRFAKYMNMDRFEKHLNKLKRNESILKDLAAGMDREAIKAHNGCKGFIIDLAIEWDKRGRPTDTDDYIRFPKEEEITQPEVPPETNKKKLAWQNDKYKTYLQAVNQPLEIEEQRRLETLEKQVGRKLIRIMVPINTENQIIGPEFSLDEDFPAKKYPNHYMAIDGRIYLLSLRNLNLATVPPVIVEFPYLICLNLQHNKLSTVLETMATMKCLETVILDHNEFTQVPLALINLQNLKYVSFLENKIDLSTLTPDQRKLESRGTLIL